MSGLLLLLATVAALAWANLGGSYASFWDGPRHYVNDWLMVVFFFVVGLEIKRELFTGELTNRRVAALPVVAAVGGMVVPALVFLAVTAGDPHLAPGWAIPIATDIVFVVAVVSALGDRVPPSLRVFLLSLAVVDDIGAIVVIAMFYGGGVHPTVVAVVAGLLVPGRMCEPTETKLRPVSSYVVVPVFALANAGVVITAQTLRTAVDSQLFWGIAAGLVVGKTVGIFAASRLASVLRIGHLPPGGGWVQVLGGATLSGIGFTVALFIAGLAFGDGRVAADLGDIAKLAILAGSTVSALLGGAVLMRAAGPTRPSSR